jgi:hypothetical protein
MRNQAQRLAYCAVVELMEWVPAADLLGCYVRSTLESGKR